MIQKRLNIRVSESQYLVLRELSARRGISLTATVQEAIDLLIRANLPVPPPSAQCDPLRAWAAERGVGQRLPCQAEPAAEQPGVPANLAAQEEQAELGPPAGPSGQGGSPPAPA